MRLLSVDKKIQRRQSPSSSVRSGMALSEGRPGSTSESTSKRTGMVVDLLDRRHTIPKERRVDDPRSSQQQRCCYRFSDFILSPALFTGLQKESDSVRASSVQKQQLIMLTKCASLS